jgi:hypothetical protein
MKKQIDGKRFSRREQRTPETWEELEGVFQEEGRLNEDGSRSIGGWQEFAENVRGWAAGFLEGRGLPSATHLYWTKGGKRPQRECPPREAFGGFRTIDAHIKALGYARDSLEDLAARMIWNAHLLLETDNSDHAILAAMELMKARTLAVVYGMESETAKKNAQKSKKKAWACELARDLAGSHETFADAWKYLERQGEVGFFSGYEVYRDGDCLCATNDRTGESEPCLSREAFRTGYFSPARNGKL